MTSSTGTVVFNDAKLRAIDVVAMTDPVWPTPPE